MTAQEQQIQAEIAKLTLAAPGTAHDIETALARIRELTALVAPQAAAVAAQLLKQIRETGQPAAGETSGDHWLKAGLTRLQDAVTREASSYPPKPVETPASTPGNSLADDPELIAEFVAEAREHISSVESNLLTLEKDPSLTDAVHSVFRSFHTIKGLAGFLALAPIQAVAHETETLLDHARERRISIGPQLIDVALLAADYIRVALDALSSKSPQEAMEGLAPNDALLRSIATAAVLLPLGARSDAPQIASAGEAPTADAPPEPVASGVENPAPPAAKRNDASTVRVDTAKLEYLVEMVGELVIAQSLIHFSPENDAGAAAGLSRNFAQLGRVTSEIQKTAMSMQMVPISRLYDKMARLVRDLARKSGKRIELKRIGDRVELDRNIVEEITDPFVHMIRNSVDHGIEDAGARVASGKNETAYITLEAFHQAGYINLRMSDDGRGLCAARIREKAVQKGLISPDAKIDEQSINRLIFEPGFSTAERVTSISGRGVGMDVVRRQIEKLRGTIQIDSKEGLGCAFTLKVPLTLAMVDGLILESGGERYVLPIYSVREMFHVTPEKLFTVESRAEMILLRGSLLPVVRLDRFFAHGRRDGVAGEIGIVVEGRARQFCLVVDRLLGKQEVVIKALGACFKNVTGVAGGAILGDGRVGLILDVHGVGGGDDSEV